jgi:membrane protein DedA with SNARE-associated domain
VILAAAVGVAGGGCGGYWIGRTGGHAVVMRYGRWVGIREQELNHASAFFARHGAAAVVTGRFLPVIRILTGIVAGITGMPFKRFAAVNAAAGLVWSVVFGVLGYEFSRNMFRFEHQYGRTVVIGIIVAALVAFGLLKWYEARSNARAEVDVKPKVLGE